MKTVPAIDYQGAKRIVDAIVEKALQLQKAAVIVVADAHGELIAPLCQQLNDCRHIVPRESIGYWVAGQRCSTMRTD